MSLVPLAGDLLHIVSCLTKVSPHRCIRVCIRSCSSSRSCILDVLPQEYPFDWDSEQQGLILGAFYIGYIFTHIPGGLIADRYGGKHTLGIGILATAFCTFLTPLACKIADVGGAIGIRILMGVGEVRSACKRSHVHQSDETPCRSADGVSPIGERDGVPNVDGVSRVSDGLPAAGALRRAQRTAARWASGLSARRGAARVGWVRLPGAGALTTAVCCRASRSRPSSCCWPSGHPSRSAA